MGVGAGDGVQRVHHHAEVAAAQQLPNLVEVEQGLHQLRVVVHWVDHFDDGVTNLDSAELIQVDVVKFGDLVLIDLFAAFENGAGDFFGSGATIASVVLDAKVALGATRVMARGENDATKGIVFANDAGGCGGGEDATLSHQHATKPVGNSHFQDDLNGGTVVVASVAPQHEGFPFKAI